MTHTPHPHPENLVRGEAHPVPRFTWPAIGSAFLWVLAGNQLGLGVGPILAVFVLLLGCAAILTRHVIIDLDRRELTQADLLLGRWPLTRETLPLGSVVAIGFRFIRDADSGGKVEVGPRLRDGRACWLKAFEGPYGEVTGEALAFAQNLGRRLGVPVDD